MYNKIGHKNEVESLKNIPLKVANKIKEIAESLDKKYGVERDENKVGGYIIFVDNEIGLENVCDMEIDIERCTVEKAEIIETEQGTYINALFMPYNDFSITVIMPEEIAPNQTKDKIEYI